MSTQKLFMMKKIVLVSSLFLATIFAGNFYVNAQSADYNVKWSAVNLSKDNVNAVSNGARPGDLVRYELVLSGGEGPGTYNPRIDVSDLLNKSELISSVGGNLEGETLVFPQKLCAGCEEQKFSFLFRVKDICGKSEAMSVAMNNVKITVPFECDLVKTGPDLLIILSAGLMVVIMGYFIFSLRKGDTN